MGGQKRLAPAPFMSRFEYDPCPLAPHPLSFLSFYLSPRRIPGYFCSPFAGPIIEYF